MPVLRWRPCKHHAGDVTIVALALSPLLRWRFCPCAGATASIALASFPLCWHHRLIALASAQLQCSDTSLLQSWSPCRRCAGVLVLSNFNAAHDTLLYLALLSSTFLCGNGDKLGMLTLLSRPLSLSLLSSSSERLSWAPLASIHLFDSSLYDSLDAATGAGWRCNPPLCRPSDWPQSWLPLWFQRHRCLGRCLVSPFGCLAKPSEHLAEAANAFLAALRPKMLMAEHFCAGCWPIPCCGGPLVWPEGRSHYLVVELVVCADTCNLACKGKLSPLKTSLLTVLLEKPCPLLVGTLVDPFALSPASQTGVCPVTKQSQHVLASLPALHPCCCWHSAGIVALVTRVSLPS